MQEESILFWWAFQQMLIFWRRLLQKFSCSLPAKEKEEAEKRDCFFIVYEIIACITYELCCIVFIQKRLSDTDMPRVIFLNFFFTFQLLERPAIINLYLVMKKQHSKWRKWDIKRKSSIKSFYHPNAQILFCIMGIFFSLSFIYFILKFIFIFIYFLHSGHSSCIIKEF